MAQSAILLGATGLTGSFLLQALLEDDDFSEVTILVRKMVDISSPKLKQVIVDFNDHTSFKAAIGASTTIFCCIGTTMKKVKGDKALYEKIDVDIPVNAAIFGAEKGARKFIVISAIGANAESSIFYNRLKGKAEKGIIDSGIPSVFLFRPALLTGPRKERRPMEKLADVLMNLFHPLMKGSWSKYHSMPVSTLAMAMKNAAKQDEQGVRVLYYEDIIKFI